MIFSVSFVGVLFITALLCCLFPGVFFLIAFIFSVIPNTRDINITAYNKLVTDWIEFSPVLHGTNITIQSDISKEISFYNDYRPIDTVPNTRADDHFQPYDQIRFIAPNFDYYELERFQIGVRRSFTVKMKNKEIGESQASYSFGLFSSSSYCCSSSKNGCRRYCYRYYRLSGFCLVLDLKFQKVLQQGCYGGFGHLGYQETARIETSTSGFHSLSFDVMAREIRDPWYQIPYIIGFGGGNTWGVTQSDRIIVLSVFYAACGISCLIYGICFLISLVGVATSYYFEKDSYSQF
eukprot:gene2544-3506_t